MHIAIRPEGVEGYLLDVGIDQYLGISRGGSDRLRTSLYASAVRGRLHLEGIRRVTGNWEQLLADGRQCGELSDRE
jgi:hypothetical protein